MTAEDRELLTRINAYAEQNMKDIEDPQKVLVSIQLDRLKPILETIAKEKGISLEDMFIRYMDIQSEASCQTDDKMREMLKDLNEGDDTPLLYR